MFKRQKHKKINKKKVSAEVANDVAAFLAKGGKVKQCEHGETELTHKQLINPDQRRIN